VPDVDGRLALVACQHPHADVGAEQRLDRRRHALRPITVEGEGGVTHVLQLVLDGGRADEQQVRLDLLGHRLETFVAYVSLVGGERESTHVARGRVRPS